MRIAWCVRRGVQLYCLCPMDGCNTIHYHGAGSFDEKVLLGHRTPHCENITSEGYELKMITQKMLTAMHLKVNA